MSEGLIGPALDHVRQACRACVIACRGASGPRDGRPSAVLWLRTGANLNGSRHTSMRTSTADRKHVDSRPFTDTDPYLGATLRPGMLRISLKPQRCTNGGVGGGTLTLSTRDPWEAWLLAA
jgi:hypothetical protein